MPKTAADATRFTATGPYASNMASSTATLNPSSTRIDFGKAPPNETPQQKIARLRAAAALARRPKEDTFDKVVRIGRRWADRAHRVTALSLLGLTIVSVLVAGAGITDLVLHNRRRRRDWYAEQDLKRAADVQEAKAALGAGTITQDQLLLLGQERAKFEAAEARKNKPGMFKSASNYLFGGLAKEEQKGGRLAAAPQPTPSIREQVAEMVQTTQTVAIKTEEAVLPQGGPLDRQAQHIYDAALHQGTSWRKWLLRQP
ncbi:hypothetical protein AMS68_001280 [Peltaster fructicola]|uniref:Uncharacterized protein n=1 Tax=Peltaster fructicola TaxID=286661 RepID=A0A6H0XM19_9PEZI|nr:hypothetical protein AMS68_001280 [Peltaster fructicola]